MLVKCQLRQVGHWYMPTVILIFSSMRISAASRASFSVLKNRLPSQVKSKRYDLVSNPCFVRRGMTLSIPVLVQEEYNKKYIN